MFHGSDFALSRRQFLIGGSAMAAAGCLGSAPALAKAPMWTDQAPAFFRFKIGGFEATVVSDGPLPLGQADKNFLVTPAAEINKMMTDNFLDPKDAVLEQNVLFVNTGDQLIMFDAGMGYHKMYGPTTGKLLENMKLAGIDPASVDGICITHGHIDHITGIADENGKSHFPNAKIYINETEYKFWTDEKILKDPIPWMVEYGKCAQACLAKQKEHVVFTKDGDKIIPGITTMMDPGHTIAHSIFIIESEGKKVMNIGDTFHHQVILLEKPKTQFKYDTNPAQSVQSRIKVLSMAADEKIPLLAFHFPWPGYAHIVREGDGFRSLPVPPDMSKIG